MMQPAAQYMPAPGPERPFDLDANEQSFPVIRELQRRYGRFHVPAGTDVFVCPYLLHRHATLWQDPEEFRPARFETAAERQRHDFAYLPFSARPRHCVGEGFAMAEMAMHLTMVARRFRLEYRGAAPPDMEFQINLRTGRDLPMHVLAR
jgi:cytochrome P450